MKSYYFPLYTVCDLGGYELSLYGSWCDFRFKKPTSIQVIGAHGGHTVTMVAGHVFIFNQPVDPVFFLPIEKMAPFKTNFPRNCLFAIAASGSRPWRWLPTPAIVEKKYWNLTLWPCWQKSLFSNWAPSQAPKYVMSSSYSRFDPHAPLKFNIRYPTWP